MVKDGKEINWVETKKEIQDIKTYFPLLQKILNAITIPTSQKGKKRELRPKLVTDQIEGGKTKKDKKPKSLDEKVARLHLTKLGVSLDRLNNKQARYINDRKDGPFKPEYYRY